MYADPRDWLGFVGSPHGDRRAGASETLRVEISAEVLQQLLAKGDLCAADMRCLDAASKERLQRICLSNCARCMPDEECGELDEEAAASALHAEEPLLPA